MHSILKKLLVKLGALLYQVNYQVGDATLPRFGNLPRNLRIELPRRITNPERMFLGDDVRLGPGSLLAAVTSYPTPTMRRTGQPGFVQEFNPTIVIGDRVTATGNLQVAAMSTITIEDDVMLATNVNITDGLHGYENANEPFKYQKMFRIAPITIKRGCWIGQNVVILPGVTIGEFTIIGANSVVTESVPDRSIAVGAPASVIKKWNKDAQTWAAVTRGEPRARENGDGLPADQGTPGSMPL